MPSSTGKSIVLITGANGGIGLETARQLSRIGTYHVLLGSRSVEKGEIALQQLRNENVYATVNLVQIDVTSDGSIANAADAVRNDFGHLDVLINNAGISGQAGGSVRESMRASIETNAVGAALVGEAFAPLLLASSGTPRIINVSSNSGSITSRLDASSPSYKMPGILHYRMSKAAMNMVTADQHAMLGPTVKVFAWCPGFTVSNLTNMNSTANGATPTDEAVLPLLDIVEGKRDADGGRFLSSTGLHPW